MLSSNLDVQSNTVIGKSKSSMENQWEGRKLGNAEVRTR